MSKLNRNRLRGPRGPRERVQSAAAACCLLLALGAAPALPFTYSGQVKLGGEAADGSLDVLVGATGADSGVLSASGAGYLVAGPLSGTHSLSAASAVLLGGDSYVYTGQSMTAADINDDGLIDLLISSYGADSVFGFFGGGL